MFAQVIRPAVMMVVVMTILTGGIYSLTVTGLARMIFPSQSGGSLIHEDGQAVGSALIGQPFDDLKYFWGRPSATAPFPYNASASSGSNLGPLDPALTDAVAARIEALKRADPANTAAIPVDLVTASGSGLDPHITPAAAEFQIARVARTRGLEQAAVQALVARHTQPRTLGLLGEPCVNVVALNIELDQMTR